MSFDCHVFLASLICSCDYQNNPLIVSIIEGQRVVTGKNRACEDCTDGYFQETVNYSQYCKVCRKCDKGEALTLLLSDIFLCIQRSCICQMFKSSIPFQTCKMCVWTPSFVAESGSDVAHPCTKISNTICKCRKGFVASDNDFSTCQCEAGFGKKSGGKVWSQDTERCQFVCLFVWMMFCLCLPECTKCEDGHFSKSINSPCQKWKEYVHPSWF